MVSAVKVYFWESPDGSHKNRWITRWREDGRTREKRFPPTDKGKLEADIFKMELLSDDCIPGVDRNAKWDKLVQLFRGMVYPQYGDHYKRQFDRCVGHIERVIRPMYVRTITSRALQEYVAQRLSEEGMPGKNVEPATVEHELRVMKALLKKADEWDMLLKMPVIPKLKVNPPDVGYMPIEDFSLIYDHCNAATCPKFHYVTPEQWWRGFLTFLFMTGWRVGQALSLKWNDVYPEKNLVISWSSQNKGRRAEYVPVHDVVMKHMSPLAATHKPKVFHFTNSPGGMRLSFERIQRAAGVVPCTPGNKPYTFHDIRRGFATANRNNVTPEELQRMMQHTSLSTTKKYIKIADSLKQPVKQLAVPDCFLKSSEKETA